MGQSDIKYILELLADAVERKDWEIIEEASDALKEFLDDDSDDDE